MEFSTLGGYHAELRSRGPRPTKLFLGELFPLSIVSCQTATSQKKTGARIKRVGTCANLGWLVSIFVNFSVHIGL